MELCIVQCHLCLAVFSKVELRSLLSSISSQGVTFHPNPHFVQDLRHHAMPPTPRATSATSENNRRMHSRPHNRQSAMMTVGQNDTTCARRQGSETPACRAGWYRYRAGAEHQSFARKTVGKSTMTLSNLTRRLRRFLRERKGVSALEYAILVGVIAVGIGGALVLFEGQVETAIDVHRRRGRRYARQPCRSGSRWRRQHQRRQHQRRQHQRRHHLASATGGRWGVVRQMRERTLSSIDRIGPPPPFLAGASSKACFVPALLRCAGTAWGGRMRDRPPHRSGCPA